jgi:hypothetical protein
MSTRPAPRSLLQGLVDDAAVFPPGNAPVARAWEEHLALRAGRYGDLLGPLLVGTSDVADLLATADAAPPVEDLESGEAPDPDAVRVAVVARPGTDVEDLLAAAATVRGGRGLDLASVEIAHDPGGAWRRALDLGVPVAVEVPRDPARQAAALDDLVSVPADSPRVVAKLRTQSTPSAAAPSPRELADFLLGALRHDLPFKLTGGLHHAVAGEVELPDGAVEFQHGVLNVLLAAHYLEDHRLPLTSLEGVLASTDADGLAALTRGLAESEVPALRSRLLSFGCCGVTDPLDELTELGVLPA